MSKAQLSGLFDLLSSSFDVQADAEISIECNPDDINPSFCTAMSDVGATRISIGVQSFDSEKLKFLERDHRPEQIFTAVDTVKNYFDNFSLDLIFATQHEQLETWMSDLRQALQLNPNHLSTYELTVEKGTQFWNRRQRGMLTVPDEDFRADLYEATIDRLKKAGYEHYEISSFAHPGFHCRHNQTYWDGSGYLAFGASAARYVNGTRETNHRSTTRYMTLVEAGKSPVFESESVSVSTQLLERIAFGLRQLKGVNLSEVYSKFETVPASLLAEVDKALNRFRLHNLLEIDGAGHLKMTDRGILLYDSIASELLSVQRPDPSAKR